MGWSCACRSNFDILFRFYKMYLPIYFKIIAEKEDQSAKTITSNGKTGMSFFNPNYIKFLN